MINYTLAFSLWLLIGQANAQTLATCREAEIKIIYDKRPILSKEMMCEKKLSNNLTYYMSPRCEKGDCAVLKRKKSNLIIPNYIGNIGSPGFKLCEKLGGVPQIFEFKMDGRDWESTERCLFGEDFIEISFLTQTWKDYIKN